MLKKLSAFILVTSATATFAFAQKSPEPAKPARPAVPGTFFTFSTEMSGGYLGLGLSEVTTANYQKLGLGEVRGAAVEKVAENSPAAKAGLQTGDVVVKFDGESVTSVRKLQRLIAEVSPDHKVTMTIVRGGAEQEITVVMGKREMPAMYNGSFGGTALTRELPVFPQEPAMPQMPQMQNMPQMPRMPNMPRIQSTQPGDDSGTVFLNNGANAYVFGSSRQLGVSVSNLSKQLAEYFGTDGKGLLINEVRADTAAAKAGLRAGDVILEIDGKSVDSSNDLVRAVNSKKEGDIVLTVVRDRQTMTINVTPDRSKTPGVQTLRPQMPAGSQSK